jgi:hypothetical protein
MGIFSKDKITGLTQIPPMDAEAPANLETATFALG